MPRTAEVIYVGDAASLIKANSEALASSNATADGMASAASRAAAAQERAQAKTLAAGKAAATSFGKLGRDSAVGIAAIGVASVVMGAKLEKATAEIAAAGDITEKIAGKITSAFGHMGEGENSATKVAEAYASVAGELKVVEHHALGTSEALKVMNAAERLSLATGEKLKPTTESIGKVMLTYGIHAGGAAKASDILYEASKRTGQGVDTLSGIVDKMHGRLGALAPSLSESAGLMSALAAKGAVGRPALTALNGVFTTLVGGGKKVSAMANQLGLDIYSQNGKFVGLKSVIAQLQPVLSKLTPEMQLQATKALFGGTANKQLINVILEGPNAYSKAIAAVDKHGTAQHAAALQSQTLEGQWEKERTSLENVGATIGKELIPILKAMTSDVEESVEWLKHHEAEAIALAGVITTVLGAALTVYAYTKAAAFVNATKDMIGGMKLLAEKVGITTAEVATSFDGIPTAAEAAAARTAQVQAGLADSIEGEDAAIVTANEEAGASFTAMLGPIGAVALALAAAQPLIQKLTGGDITNTSAADKAAHNWTGEPGVSSWMSAGSTANKSAAFLQERGGLSAAAAAGVTKILGAESGLSTTNRGSEGAYGIAQWLGSRLEGLEKFAGQTGKSGNSLETQLEYLMKELKGPEAHTLAKLKGATSTKQAEQIFVEDFERPKKENYGAIYERAAGYHVATHTGDAGAKLDHSGKKSAAKKAEEHLKQSGSGTVQTSEQLAEAEADAKKKTASDKTKEYLGPKGEVLHETAAQHAHRTLEERKSKIEHPGASSSGKLFTPHGGAYGFFEEPHTNYTKGKEEEIAARLDKLGKAEKLHLKGVSGYRTAAHSLEVGGFADDPHTKGEASDTPGVEHVSEAILKKFGLTRPFYNIATGAGEAKEADHIQIAPGTKPLERGGKAVEAGGIELKKVAAAQEAINKAEEAKRTADGKKGGEQLKTIQAAIQSKSLEQLNQVVGGKHDTYLARLVAKLSMDHTTALSGIAAKLVAAHKAALAAIVAAEKAAVIARAAHWNEAIDSIKKQAPELVSQAGQAWKAIQQGMIEAAHKAALLALESGPLANAIKSKHEEDEAESTRQTEESNTKTLTEAQKKLKEAKGNENPEEIKTASEDLKHAEEAITAFVRQQDEKRAEKKLAEETSAIDASEEAEVNALAEREAAYENMLTWQLTAQAEQLRKSEINYAQYATHVNEILAASGITYGGNDEAQKKLEEISGGVVPYETAGGKEEGFVRVGMPPKPQRKAVGGRVYPGVSYVGGETGAEMFTPDVAGTITPASRTGGVGGGATVLMTGPVTLGSRRDADRLAQQTAHRLQYGGR